MMRPNLTYGTNQHVATYVCFFLIPTIQSMYKIDGMGRLKGTWDPSLTLARGVLGWSSTLSNLFPPFYLFNVTIQTRIRTINLYPNQ